MEEAVKAAEHYALVSKQPSRSNRNRDATNSVAGVEGNGLMSDVKDMFQTVTGKLDEQAALIREQAARISALERPKAGGYNHQAAKASGGPKRCYHCGDPSHFKRDCPDWLRSQGAGIGKPYTQKSENC
jgi:hypothetical protein